MDSPLESFGEVVREERPGANGATLAMERAYNARGQLVSTTAMTEARTDAYGYNDRSELTSAAKLGGSASVPATTEYAYQYDDIGNRVASTDLGTNRTYTANFLNQYTLISNLCDSVTLCDDFVPQYDLDGNQTLVKTSTGVWQVSYNGENRPVLWTCGTTNIVMAYDRMGRRVLSRETVGGVVTGRNHTFVYDGYLCLRRLDAATKKADMFFTWDPAESVATRLLMVERPGKYKMHVTHDGNKNVSELVFFSGGSGIAAHYEYAPFGAVTASTRSTSVTAYDFRTYNPFRFSSEYADDALGLVYYNYRHYNPLDGRWISRDRAMDSLNSYALICNALFLSQDYLGLVDRTTVDLIISALEILNGNPIGLWGRMALPTIVDMLDENTQGFIKGAINWFFYGRDVELNFDSYDPGWSAREFDENKYDAAIESVCDNGHAQSFSASRIIDTYKNGLYAIARLGGPGQYTVRLDGGFRRERKNGECRWVFQGKVTIPPDPFDFNKNGKNRSWAGQLITEIVSFMQEKFGIGHNFNITFKGSRSVDDEGSCCD